MPKRVAETVEAEAAPAVKCQKTSVDAKYAPVFVGIQRALAGGILSEESSQMFASCLVGSLGTAPAERHQSQKRVIEMLGEILEAVKASLQEISDAAESKVQEVEASKESLDGKVEEAEQALKAALEESGAKASSLADAMEQEAKAQAAAEAISQAQKQGETDLITATKQQEEFSAIVENHFAVLQAGEFGEEGPEQHKDVVLKLLETLEVEESCRLSVPLVCVKPCSQRTSFDTMVMHTVTEDVEKRSAELAAKVQELTAAAAASTSELEAAANALKDAQAHRELSETAEVESVVREKEAKKTMTAAKKARANFEPELAVVTSARTERSQELETFVSQNIGCLVRLRDGESLKEVAEPAGDAAEAACLGGA